jgi:hypothetical protein
MMNVPQCAELRWIVLMAIGARGVEHAFAPLEIPGLTRAQIETELQWLWRRSLVRARRVLGWKGARWEASTLTVKGHRSLANGRNDELTAARTLAARLQQRGSRGAATAR